MMDIKIGCVDFIHFHSPLRDKFTFIILYLLKVSKR